MTRTKPTTVANLEAAGSNSLPITRGVIEALRDETDQDLLGKRLASEAALSSVLEKALLLQRTLLTGKKEPNVAANELATKAVDQENSALEQEINNLKTELELRRTLAGNPRWRSFNGIARGPADRAASSRVTRPATGSRKCRNHGARHEWLELACGRRGCWNRRVASGLLRTLLWVLLVACVAVGVNIAGIHVVGSVDGWQRWLKANRVISSPGGCSSMRRRPMAGGGCAAALLEREPSGRVPSTPAARRDRGRDHPRIARGQSSAARKLRRGGRHDPLHDGLSGVLPDPGRVDRQQRHLEHPGGQRHVRAAVRCHRDP